MLNLNPISFKGNLVRQTKPVRDPNAPFGRRSVETTRTDLINSYDYQIDKIEAYKQFALQLDDMMFNDEDIQRKISSLPEDTEIEVAAQFSFNGDQDCEDIDLCDPMLIAESDEFDENSALHVEFNPQGPNKQEILEWLDQI